MVHAGEIIEGPCSGEEATLLLAWADALEKICKAGKLGMGACFHEVLGGGGGEAFKSLETETERLLVEDDGFTG